MKFDHIFATALLLFGLALPMGLRAEVVPEPGLTLQLEQPALDMASSVDGKRLFVLNKGKVVIYSADGVLQGTVEVDPALDRITVPAQGDSLYLSSSSQKKVQEIRLGYVVSIDTAGDPFRGAADAPVELVVFSDFQCPYCARVEPLLDQLLANNPGRLKVVFKNFPLAMHKAALPAAMASLAAHRQGKFWPMHDLLFQHSRELTPQKIEELAVQAGLDMDRFHQDMAAPELKQRVTQDLRAGQEAGVRGTPTLFINGRLVRDRSVQGMQQLVNQALASAGK